jgi:Na+/melibiose symporter-like transporter
MGGSIGVLASLLVVGGMIARFGSRRVIAIGAAVSCLVLPLLAVSPNPALLGFSLFLFGSGLTVMDVAMNDQAVLVERAASRPLMSSFHAGFSVGGLAGALIGSWMASLPVMTPLLHFTVIAVASAIGMAALYPLLISTETGPSERPPAFRLPVKALWLLGAIAFCSTIGEGAVGSWSGVYLTRIFGTTESFAALGFAAFSLTMTAGRIFGDALAKAWPSDRIIRAGGAVAAAGLAAAVFTPAPVIVMIGFGAVGLGLANIIPLAFSAAGNTPGVPSGAGIAAVATIGYAAFLAGPPVVGLLAEATSLRVGLALVMVLVGSLVVSGRALAGNRG